ncbi:hypothetical protein [Nitrosomonas supralitoralis]|uniref:Pentapeptide MXKDX repeat protein n=1 Tax=Nitrosomonas supralitoralis TaxID=2116706 RepID=A0A2P7NVX2_9PROT|nr:hypothetical protein [Nitrosomonas supralitoralis]PSJ17622.1 hypothetical protein C7H79_06880 [Nitrosomonas supralitoralis]
MLKVLIAIFISGFLFVSGSTFAGDYSQTQNKVDDKMNSPQKAESDKKNADADRNKQNNMKKEDERMNKERMNKDRMNNMEMDNQRRNESQ